MLAGGDAQSIGRTGSPDGAKAEAMGKNTVMFSMADEGDAHLEVDTHGVEQRSPSGSQIPEIPPPAEDYSTQDVKLHEALATFYLQHRPDNLRNLNTIVRKYRGRHATQLWASLAVKYDIPPREALDLLGSTLYRSSAYEYDDGDKAESLEQAVAKIHEEDKTATHSKKIERALNWGVEAGDDGPLRLMAFRGLSDEGTQRAQVWKVLLGYLPMARYSEWGALQGEKRALYASYKQEMLSIDEQQEVTVKEAGPRATEYQELLQEIRNDVDRTRRDFEYFRKPATRGALLSLLYVYARLNPGVKYVQGMNEVAAVVLWVLSGDPECAEADTFWCFSELMVEVKEGFMQAFDDTGEGVHGMVRGVMHLLRMYDYELARHLQKCELPPVVFLVRWCTVLFAQDASLPDAVRLWDSFIADPRRFEFVIHVALALIMSVRDRLMATDKQFELAEVLQAAPREADFEDVLRKACTICAFERRSSIPVFPAPKSHVMEEISEWAENAARTAQIAAARASIRASAMTRTLEESIAPVVVERVGQAGDAVAIAASEGAMKVQHWLEETAPARREALGQAQTHLSSWWDTVKATSAAASQRLAEEYRERSAASGAGGHPASAAATAASSTSGPAPPASHAGAGAGDGGSHDGDGKSRFANLSGAATSFWARTTAAAAAFAADPVAGDAGTASPAASAPPSSSKTESSSANPVRAAPEKPAAPPLTAAAKASTPPAPSLAPAQAPGMSAATAKAVAGAVPQLAKAPATAPGPAAPTAATDGPPTLVAAPPDAAIKKAADLIPDDEV